MKAKVLLPIILMLLFAVTRWPGFMQWNFSAAYAMMFCAGVYFPKKLAWWLPICTMLVVDLLLNIYYHSNYNDSPILSPDMIGNYLAYFGILWLGRKFNPRSSFLSLLAGGLIGALIFYFVTNTFSWLINPFQNPEYTKTFWGWLIALTKGTTNYVFPIRLETWEMFRNTLSSGGLFTALFAGAMKFAEALGPVDKEEPAKEEAGESPETPPEEAKAS